MSYVSSYCILTSISDEDEEVLAAINAFSGLNGAKFKRIDEHAGGNKAMQVTIYAGAFNQFDEEAFLAHLQTAVPWRERSRVRVFLNSEHDTGWTELLIVKGPLVEPKMWKSEGGGWQVQPPDAPSE